MNISPKVWAAVAALVSPGLVLVLVGALVGNDELLQVGVTLLGAAGVGGYAGYRTTDPDRK